MFWAEPQIYKLACLVSTKFTKLGIDGKRDILKKHAKFHKFLMLHWLTVISKPFILM